MSNPIKDTVEREHIRCNDQIHKNFTHLSTIGQSADSSVTRLLFSEAYMEAAQTARKYMEEAGLTAWIDVMGNVHGQYDCKKEGAKTVYMGSHLDTVKQGGLYDGMLGFVAAVESFRELKKNRPELNCNIHILGTNGEEGNDLGGTFGSRAMTGLIDADAPGYLEKAKAYGLKREDFETVKLPMEDGLCYLELHIEQGNTLDQTGEEIGIVTGIVGLERYAVTVYGESNHAGTTMMEYRKDAMVGAAKLIAGFDRLAREYENQMVATVGAVSVFPGAVSVIPERVEMVLEIRNLSASRLTRFYEDSVKMAKELPDVTVTFERLVKKAPVQCDGDICAVMEEICGKHGFSYRHMPSGATHDGNAMAAKMPIAMVFVPSRGGVSHNKNEYTDWQYVEKGMTVLYETLETLNDR